MPRLHELDQREREICQRLQEYRKNAGLSRVAFAQKAGIDSSVLVRYEHGRVPLKYIHAWRFMRVFFINPRWLATGENGKWTRSAQFAPGPDLLQLSEAALFSEVFDRVLSRPEWADRQQKSGPDLTPSELRVRHECLFQYWLRDRLLELPDSSVPQFIERLKTSGESLLKKYPKDTPEATEKRRTQYEIHLDTDARLRLYGNI